MSEKYKSSYHLRAEAQSLAWAQGSPYHNVIDDECCPDFSCCHPDLFEKDESKRWQYHHKQYGNLQ